MYYKSKRYDGEHSLVWSPRSRSRSREMSLLPCPFPAVLALGDSEAASQRTSMGA